VATRGLGISLLRHHRFIDHLIETPDPFASPLSTARSLRASLVHRALDPDLIATGASDRRFGIAALAFSAWPAVRGGFTLYPELYHRPLQYDPSRSLIDNNLQLAELAGASSEHREPRVFFSTADLDKARAMAQSAHQQSRPLAIFVTQNSGGQRTGWYTARFAEVIRYAHYELGCEVAYVGTDKDSEPIAAIRKAADGIGTSFAGRTSVTELAALLCLSDVAVSLDTGTMHIGRAVGLPLVVLGPSWQAPIEWLPLGVPNVTILRGPDIDRRNIPEGYLLDEIDSPSVCAALHDLLRRYPPSESARSERIAASISSVDHLQ
jgi:ADP-heptose:LPS heptosyltransferase